MDIPPLLVKSAQLAELLQVGNDTVKRLADDGRIPFVKLTPHTRRFDPEAVLVALRRNCGTPAQSHGEEAR